MYGHNKTLAILFTALLIMPIFKTDANSSHPQEFTLNIKNLGLLFHRTTTTALLQSKARKELQKLQDPIQSTLYNQCVQEARNLLSLSKCVARVLDERDLKNSLKKQTSIDCRPKEENNDGGWLGQLFNSLFGGLDCLNVSKTNQSANKTVGLQHEKMQKLAAFKRRYERIKHLRQKSRRIKPLQRIDKERQKRSFKWPTSSNECRKKLPENVKTLRQVESYFGQLNGVIGYVYEISKSNERFFRQMNMNINYKQSANLDPTRRQLNEFVNTLESFDDKAVVSILSPRLLNLLPQTPRLDPESKDWLSPNMLSFQDEGMLPLPRLLQMSTSSHCETLEWLDLLMHMSGASKMINSMIGKFGNHMKEMEQTVHPRVQQYQKHEQKFENLFALNTDDQLNELQTHGFTKLNNQQLFMAYGPDGIHVDTNGLEFKEDEDIEVELENEIKQMSQMTEDEFKQKVNEQLKNKANEKGHHRQKRDWIDTVLPMTTQKQIGGFRVLNPFAFTQRVRNANILGPYILSPYAFFIQLFAPTILGADVLSPRAFIATIFSPVILTARILSPAAFRMMLFSPLMLAVLVPESFSLKLFSPKLLEARILSSDSFSFILLTAGILRAGSPNAFTVLVLSPAIGTYQLFSGNRNVIQILSPGILGVDQKPILKEPLDELKEAARAGRPPPPNDRIIPGLTAPASLSPNGFIGKSSNNLPFG
ncbi:hypothetical protein M3Y97_00328000 [Aphelenchoides bicaudatus]|nr:hypothetical protein M3Y97_00328000 [Aphelenchoides bicaudatus]